MRYSVAMDETINDLLKNHLIRTDLQEDLCFALYSIASGRNRTSGIINQVIFPEVGDRNVHGNVSFNSCYFDKVTQTALREKKGIVFLHSHLGDGWQDMSRDDIETENMLSPRIKAITNMPLIGMTIGHDGAWSARFWNKTAVKTYQRIYCESVRVVGKMMEITINKDAINANFFGESFERTISAWGKEQQAKIANLKVGIVGIGSVGSQISEALLRTGIKNIKLIDFDVIQKKNLDRLHGLKKINIGALKAVVYAQMLNDNKLYAAQKIEAIPYSVVEQEGFDAAVDCDILFCCVDRPWARFILNCISFAYLIPVIDGGIDASINRKNTNIEQARWRTYTITPKRRCMKCMEQYTPEDVALEQTGLLEDPTYIKGLPSDHFAKKGENVYAFSLALAGLQMQQFLSLVLHPKAVYYGPKEMDFVTGNIDFKFRFSCDDNCEMQEMLGIGDQAKKFLVQKHPIAEATRKQARSTNKDSFWKKIKCRIWSV